MISCPVPRIFNGSSICLELSVSISVSSSSPSRRCRRQPPAPDCVAHGRASIASGRKPRFTTDGSVIGPHRPGCDPDVQTAAASLQRPIPAASLTAVHPLPPSPLTNSTPPLSAVHSACVISPCPGFALHHRGFPPGTVSGYLCCMCPSSCHNPHSLSVF